MPQRLLLSLEEITLSFGGKPLFDDLSLHIRERERVCLIGKNGAGKTTLMRLMCEELELDAGKRFVLPGTRIGYLAQQFTYDAQQNVRDFVLSGLAKEERHQEQAYLAEMVMAPLDLEAEARMGTLSGGQRRRAGLARALVQNPDLLLLDEPTNHLDLQAIEWLEEYLKAWPGALVLVSHDRRFLAHVSQKVFWVDRGRVITCPYGYERFEDWQTERIEQEARELQNLQKKVEAEHSWTQGGVTGRRKRNQRRLRELGRLREKLQKDKAAYKQRSQKLGMDALEPMRASNIVAEFKNVSKRFTREDGSPLPVLRDFEHILLKGDRLGILGRNGSGKSSFLRLLSGELQPDKGHIFRSKTLDVSLFDQNRSELNPNKTLWQTLCPQGGQDVMLGHGEEARAMHVCGYLKRFMFDPKQAHDKVGTLSGGQQNRLLLAKILARPGNLLILDEPTNDLDMDTLDMLQDVLADYTGTLVLVSHDRDFLDRCVTEILAFEGEGEVMHVFGGYSDYLRQKNASPAARQAALPEATAAPSGKPKSPPVPSPGPALTYGETLELKKLPGRIEALQANLQAVQAQLDEAGLYERDPEGFQRLINAYDRAKGEMEQAETRWLELEERAMRTG